MNYEIRETLTVRNLHVSANEVTELPLGMVVIKRAAERMLNAGRNMLLNSENQLYDYYESCVLKIDGKEWSFSGREVNHDFYEIFWRLNAPEQSFETLEYTAHYDSDLYNEVWNSNGDFFSFDAYEKLFTPEVRDVFCSAWIFCFGSDDPYLSGDLYAFGTLGDKYFNGKVPFLPVSLDEAEGKWSTQEIAFCLEDPLTALEQEDCPNREELQALCDQMLSYSDGNAYGNVSFETFAEMKEYVACASRLMVVAPDSYGFVGGFIDDSASQCRILHVDMAEDGSTTFKIAQI